MRRLEAVYFVGVGPLGASYDRMAAVLDYSAHRHCPDWQITVRRIEPTPMSGVAHSFLSNSQKFEWWNKAVQGANDGDEMVLIDADMVILRPLDDLWKWDFDLAYTNKKASLPLNGGVVAIRISPQTKAFVQTWWEANARMMHDRRFHDPWRKKYAGINQASFGYLLEKGGHGLNILPIPCSEWNSERHTWHLFDPAVTRILHIKSALRRAVFGRPGREPQDIERLADVWRTVDREAHPTDAWVANGHCPAFRVKRKPIRRIVQTLADKRHGSAAQTQNLRDFRAKTRRALPSTGILAVPTASPRN